jgi:hypothetical protein
MATTETESLGSVGRQIWQAANDLIALHGGHAPLYAMRSVDQLLERGDFRAAAQWRLVWRATEELLCPTPRSPYGRH